MPVAKQRMVVEIARGIKAYLNLEAGVTRGAVPTGIAGAPHHPPEKSGSNGHVSNSEFNEVRRGIAARYLAGDGIEVGALHQALEVPPGASVRYVDRMTVEELKKQYPNLADHNLTPVDIVDDGEKLASIHDGSMDFVIANHMMEHCENPIGTLENHLRVIKPGGVLYMSVPDMRFTFDSGRPVTPLEHLVRDYEEGPEQSYDGHLEEWARIMDKVPEEKVASRVAELADTKFSIHYHVWTQTEFMEMLQYCRSNLGLEFEIEQIQKNDMEIICVLRKAGGESDANLESEFERRGPWVTKFTVDGAPYGGDFDAMKDARVDWFFENVENPRRIMELGSLEGGHTFNLAGRPNVERVLGVEGRQDNVDKAEFVKGLLAVDKAEFVVANLEETDLAAFGEFDAVFCSGLLYHLPEPWKLLEEISRVAPSVFIWTHYASEESVNTTRRGLEGMTYKEYGLADPLSGMSADSFWPTLDGLQDLLREYGFTNITLIEDDPSHPHGPAITLAASKN